MPIYPETPGQGQAGGSLFTAALRRGAPPGPQSVVPFLPFDEEDASREAILRDFDLNRQTSENFAAGQVKQVQEQAQREVNRLMAIGETGSDEFNRLAYIARTGQAQKGPSFWDRLLGVVDKPGMLGRMAASNIIKTLQGEQAVFDFGDGFKALMGRTDAIAALHGEDSGEDGRVSGSVLLNELGWQKTEGLGNSTGRFFAHFAAEVLTDLLSYVTFGGAGLSKAFVLKTFTGMADDAGRQVAEELGEAVLRRAPYQSDSAVKTLIGKPLQADIDTIIDDVVRASRKAVDGAVDVGDIDPRYGEYLNISGKTLEEHLARLAQKPVNEVEAVVRKALAQDHVIRRAVDGSMTKIIDEVAPAITARDWAHKSLRVWQQDKMFGHAAFTGGIKFGVPFIGLEKAVAGTLTGATKDVTRGLGRKLTRRLFGSNPEYVYSTGDKGLLPVARWLNQGVGKPLTEKWLDFASKWNNSGYISGITRGRIQASTVRAVERAALDAARTVDVVGTRDRLIDSVRRMAIAGNQQDLTDEELMATWRVVADALERSGGDPELALTSIADSLPAVNGGTFEPSEDMGTAITDFVMSWTNAQKNSIDVVRKAGIEIDGIENYMPHLLEGDMRKWIDEAIGAGLEFNHQGDLGDQILAALAHNVDGNAVRFEGDLVGSAQFLGTRMIGKTVQAGADVPVSPPVRSVDDLAGEGLAGGHRIVDGAVEPKPGTPYLVLDPEGEPAGFGIDGRVIPKEQADPGVMEVATRNANELAEARRQLAARQDEISRSRIGQDAAGSAPVTSPRGSTLPLMLGLIGDTQILNRQALKVYGLDVMTADELNDVIREAMKRALDAPANTGKNVKLPQDIDNFFAYNADPLRAINTYLTDLEHMAIEASMVQAAREAGIFEKGVKYVNTQRFAERVIEQFGEKSDAGRRMLSTVQEMEQLAARRRLELRIAQKVEMVDYVIGGTVAIKLPKGVLDRRTRVAASLAKRELADADVEMAVAHATDLGRSTYRALRNAGHTHDAAEILASQEMLREVDQILAEVTDEYRGQFHQEIRSWMEFFATSTADQRVRVRDLADANNLAQHEVIEGLLRDRERIALEMVKVKQQAGVDVLTGSDLNAIADQIDSTNQVVPERLEELLFGEIMQDMNLPEQAAMMESISEFVRAAQDLDWIDAEEIADKLRAQARLLDEHQRYLGDTEEEHIRWAATYINTRFGALQGGSVYNDTWDLIPYVDDGSEIYIYQGTSNASPTEVLDAVGEGGLSLFAARAAGYSDRSANPYVAVWRLSDLPREVQDHFKVFIDYKTLDNSPGFKPGRVGAQGTFINWTPDIESGVELRSVMGNVGALPAPEAVIDTDSFRRALQNVHQGTAAADMVDDPTMTFLQQTDPGLLVEDVDPVRVLREYDLENIDADAFWSEVAEAARYLVNNNQMSDIRAAGVADDINLVRNSPTLFEGTDRLAQEQALQAVNRRISETVEAEVGSIGQAAGRKEAYIAGGDSIQRDLRDSPLYEDVIAGWRSTWADRMAADKDVRYYPGRPQQASWTWNDGAYLGAHGEMKFGPGANRGHVTAIEMRVLANPDEVDDIMLRVARGEAVPSGDLDVPLADRAWGYEWGEASTLAQPKVRLVLQEQSWGSLVGRGMAENADPDTDIIVWLRPGDRLAAFDVVSLTPVGSDSRPVYVKLADVQIDMGMFDPQDHTVYVRTEGLAREASDVALRPLRQRPGVGQLARMKSNKLSRDYVASLFPDAATGDQAFDDLATRFGGLAGSQTVSNEARMMDLMQMLSGVRPNRYLGYVDDNGGALPHASGRLFGAAMAQRDVTNFLREIYNPANPAIRAQSHNAAYRARIARVMRLETGREVEFVKARYSPSIGGLVADAEDAEELFVPVLRRPGESLTLSTSEFEKFLRREKASAANLRAAVENGEFVSDDPRVLNTLLNVSDELSVEFDALAERVDYLSALKGKPIVNREAALGAKRSRRIGSDTLGDAIAGDIVQVRKMADADVHILVNPRDGRKLAPKGYVVGLGGEAEVLTVPTHAALSGEVAGFVRRNGGTMDRSGSYLLVESVGTGYRVSIVTPSTSARDAELSALSFGSESYLNLRTGEKTAVRSAPRGVGDLAQQEEAVAELRKLESMLRGNNVDGAWHQMNVPESRRLLRTILSDAELDSMTELAEVAFYSSPKRRPLLVQEELMKANRALRKELGKRDTAVEQLSELSADYATLELAALEAGEAEYHEWLGEFIEIMSDVLNVGRGPDGNLNAAGLYPRDVAGRVSKEATGDFVTRVKEAQVLANDLGFDDWERALHGALNDIPYDVRTVEPSSRLPVRVFGIDGKVIDYDFADKWDVQMIRNFMRSWQSLNTPIGIDLLQQEMGYVARAWKSMATVSRPTFHVRNLVGGVWNNQIAGVRLRDYAQVNTTMLKLRRLTQRMPFDEAIEHFDDATKDLMFNLHDQRILDLGFSASEFERLSAPIQDEWKRLSPGHAEFVPTRLGAVGMRSIEDFLRASAFARWYKEIGPEAAAQAVWDIHFDYTDVGTLDRKIKKFVPFWIWTKNNIPLQLRVLMERPGMISRYKHLMVAFDESFSTEGDTGQWPNNPYNATEAADTGIVLNSDSPFWAKLIFQPDLPVTDLNVIGNPLSMDTWMNGLGNTLNPVVTEPMSFQSQNQWGTTQAPVGLNEILRLTNFAGLTDNVEQGGRVQVGYGTKNAYLTMFPIINEYANLTTMQSSPEQRQKLGLVDDEGVTAADRARAALLTMGRGLGFQSVTPNAARAESAIARQEVYDIVDDLRARGLLTPADFDYNLGPDELESILSELYER